MFIKLDRKTITYILMILPFFRPSVFVNFERLDLLFDYWRIISMIVAIFYTLLILVTLKKFKCSLVQTSLWVYALYMFIISVFNNSSINQWGLICLAPVALIFWLERWLIYDYENSITFLYWIFTILIIINMVVLLIYGEAGLLIDQHGSVVYLLGIRTRWPDVFFPAIGLMAIMQEIKREKKYLIISIFTLSLIIVQIVMQWIASAIFGMILIALILLFISIIKKRISILTLFWASVVFNILIVFFRIQKIFSWILVTLLRKDVGLNSRTMIWDSALEVIKDNWVFGSGITSNTNFVSLYGGKLIAQGHSLVIQLWHDGGIVGLILFLASILICCRAINKTKRFGIYLCGIIIVVSIILAVSEIYFYHIYIYVMLAISVCNSEKSIKGSENLWKNYYQ